MNFTNDITARGLDRAVRDNTVEIDFEWHRRMAAQARSEAFARAFRTVPKVLSRLARSATAWLGRAAAGHRATPPHIRLG